MDNDFKISLKAARVNKGLTQEQVSKALEVSKQTVVNWENGKITIGIPQLMALSQMYDMPIDCIFLPSQST